MHGTDWRQKCHPQGAVNFCVGGLKPRTAGRAAVELREMSQKVVDGKMPHTGKGLLFLDQLSRMNKSMPLVMSDRVDLSHPKEHTRKL